MYESDEFKSSCHEQNLFQIDDNLSLKVNKKQDANSSDDSNYGGVCEGHLPVVGYVKSTYPCNLVIYSLKSETAVHVWRFGSSIIKFKTPTKNLQNKAVVLLREGLIQIVNLKTMG